MLCVQIVPLASNELLYFNARVAIRTFSWVLYLYSIAQNISFQRSFAFFYRVIKVCLVSKVYLAQPVHLVKKVSRTIQHHTTLILAAFVETIRMDLSSFEMR